ncbi:MAG: 26 kDa periplasmic immunogenic protein [Anaerolineae bacterium]|nr:26 kDa periplasmic immunogenic protein [Anaerolineae bacterium]
MNRFVQTASIMAFSAAALLGVISLAAQSPVVHAAPAQAETPPARVIVVSGTGRASGAPDQATISIGVQITAPTLAEATKQAAATMTQVLEALKKQGVDDKDIQTSAYNVNPITNYKEGQTPQITGYQVMNVVTVTVKDLKQVGNILDAGMSAGANYLGGVSFSIADPKPLETQARTAAVHDAQQKAQTLADAAGVKLGRVLSIAEGVASNPLPVMYRSAMVADAAAPGPVQAGSLDVNVNVEMRFEIAE